MPTPDFPSMTKAELIAYASSAGIDGVDSTMKKADILAAIMEAM